MNVTQVLWGQAVRLGKISGKDGGAIYGLNLTKACESRYGFLQGPRVVSEFDLTKGVNFFHGYFQERLVIDRFQVFNDGLVVEARSSTDECDAFLDDVVQWAQSEGAMEFAETGTRIYASHIEAHSDMPMSKAFVEFSMMGMQIAEFLRTYNQVTPDFIPTGFAMNNGGKSFFKIEAREGVPESSGLQFCTAPLKTSDHVTALHDFEKVVASKTSVS